MSQSDTDILNGRDALASVLEEADIEVFQTTSEGIRGLSQSLFRQLREGTSVVVVIEADSLNALDVQPLRWIFPGGFSPLVLCPSDLNDCAELGAVAVQAAKFLPGPVFILLEDAVAELEGVLTENRLPELSWDDPLPMDALGATAPEAELQMLARKMATSPTGFSTVATDPSPPELGRPEWLLITYGATTTAATEATVQARAEGQRVTTIALKQLWPVPEAAILKAAMGMKHVVMAERNLGQYAREIRRVLPELPVVPANSLLEPVSARLILDKLQRTPRCC